MRTKSHSAREMSGERSASSCISLEVANVPSVSASRSSMRQVSSGDSGAVITRGTPYQVTSVSTERRPPVMGVPKSAA